MLNRFRQHIPAYIPFFVKLYLLNVLLFFIERVLFYFYNQSVDVGAVNLSDKLMAFKTSWEFDTTIICWIFLIPFLAFGVLEITKQIQYTRFVYWFCLFCLAVAHFVSIANIPFFHQFGTHLNRTAFLWSENTSFAIGVIFGSFMYWGFILVYLPILVLLIYVSNRFYRSYQANVSHIKWYKQSVVALFGIAFLLLGMRGRIFDRSGLDEGVAIVSENGFINQLAINANFTFWKSVASKPSTQSYQVPNNINESIAFTQHYLGINKPVGQSISRQENIHSDTIHPYNVVIVVMESMCLFKMGYYNGKNLTPHLDELNKESIFCNQFFSSGIHTFNGLFSTSTGFPSIYEEQGLKQYVKKPFDGLGTLLKQQGYENYFYTTHDAHFDNMQGFFRFNKFEHIISEYDFKYSQRISSLGVPDHVLLDKLIETTNARKNNKPFLAVAMTASDHGPWKIPDNIPFKPNGETPQDNCTLYADWAIGEFMKKAKQQNWYNNTVFIFLGDHGLSMGHTYEMPLSYHHIPCIIHQPQLFSPDTISSPCYQPDITATVMGIIGASYTNNTFGINILKEKHPFVVFSADNKIGCVDDKGNYFFTTLYNKKTYLKKYQNLNPHNFVNELPQKADSLHKGMMHIYNTAQYFIQKEYLLYP